jgi:hypothetical protein
MAKIRKEQTDAFVSKEELIISLVPHVHELKSNREEPRSNVDGLKGNVKG